MMGAYPSEQAEEGLLEVQDSLFETLSIMLHHDAITGTHTDKVGKNYKHMMTTARQTARTKYGSGTVAKQIQRMAKD